MANLKEVRSRIASTISTQQITKAMKLVSATKLRRAQGQIQQMRPYAQKIKSILASLGNNTSSAEIAPYIEGREVNKVLLVVITSDRGLCGGFNANIIKTTSNLLRGKYSEQNSAGNVHLLCIGKKAYDFFSKTKTKTFNDFRDLFQNFNSENTSKAGQWVIEKFLAKEYDEVVMVYNQFKNAASQIITTEKFLPVDVKEFETIGSKQHVKKDYIFEPNQDEILKTLIPLSLKTQVFKACIDSWASEHGARMVAMDKATENAGELLKSLRLQYNQARQAAITKEISEIVGGAAAMNG